MLHISLHDTLSRRFFVALKFAVSVANEGDGYFVEERAWQPDI